MPAALLSKLDAFPKKVRVFKSLIFSGEQFYYEANSLKGIKALGRALRLEATINQPCGFKGYRTKANLNRRAEVSQAAVNRLAESLARVAETTTLGELPLATREKIRRILMKRKRGDLSGALAYASG